MKATQQDRSKAQELAYRAMDTRDLNRASALCSEALALDPRCIDALAIHALLVDDIDQRAALLSEAVQLANEVLGGRKYFEENSGHFWGLIETRPYMRARKHLAQTLSLAGYLSLATAEYEALLKLNPHDNQGNRYELIGLYLEDGNLPGARRLLAQFHDDCMAIFAWAAFMERLLSGRTAEAEAELTRARQANPYVEDYLLGRLPPPSELPSAYGHGDLAEAQFCCFYLWGAWQVHPEIVDWLQHQAAPRVAAGPDKAGRNDPCPCGSGLKHKKCCLGKPVLVTEVTPSNTGMREQMLLEVQKALEGHEDASIEELNALIAGISAQRNSAPIEDFAGLSADQMHCLMCAPFESPNVLRFPQLLDADASGPFLELFMLLAAALGEDGIKPTATGRLPREVSRQIAREFLGEEGYADYTRISKISSESDYQELYLTRFVATEAGLIRKYKGKFILSSRCRDLLRSGGPRAVYPLLLRAAAHRLNWSGLDLYPELKLIQVSFAFTLFLLQRFGAEWREKRFYEDAFLRAFPAIVSEARPHFESAEDQVRSAYSLRCLERFATFMGLVESDSLSRFQRDCKLRKTPLLDAAVKFVGMA